VEEFIRLKPVSRSSDWTYADAILVGSSFPHLDAAGPIRGTAFRLLDETPPFNDSVGQINDRAEIPVEPIHSDRTQAGFLLVPKDEK